MKKRIILFLSVLLIGLSLSSCGGDDAPSTSGDIVGKWEFSKEGEIINGNEMLYNYEHQLGCAKDNIEFKADGTYADFYFYEGCELEISFGEYTKSGTTLFTDNGFETFETTILKLDSTTLKVKTTYNDEGEIYSEVYVFKRVN